MKTYQYRGQTITKEFSQFALRNLNWGDQPGEYYSFKTLKAAKAFIDRRIAANELVSVPLAEYWA